MDKQIQEQMMKAAQNTPHNRISEQIRFLDRALNTIPHERSEETRLVRHYIIAQIEALKWAMRLLEV